MLQRPLLTQLPTLSFLPLAQPFLSNHISNFDPIWFNCVFKDFTLLCAGDYDWFWEVMKRIGVLSSDDESGKGCIYTNYFGSVAEREAVRIAIEEVRVGA